MTRRKVMPSSRPLRSVQVAVILLLRSVLGLQTLSLGVSGFVNPSQTSQLQQVHRHHVSMHAVSGSDEMEAPGIITRKTFFSTMAGFPLIILGKSATADEPTPTELKVFQLPSGVKYLDLVVGSGPTPQYGQLCSIAYKAYIKLPANKKDSNPKPQQFDQSTGYLVKHGNGRSIAGLDEGLHTIKVGGTRRILIPPKLGYVTSGLGPIPEYPWDRYQLNRLLEQMVALRGGTVIFEVTLLSAMDDEADQGYYQDGSLTPDEFEQLRNNIQRRAAQAARDREQATASAAATE